jgi:hypothetical protein
MLKMRSIMKNIITFLLLFCFSAGVLFAQDTETKKCENSNKSLLGYFMLKDGKPVSESYMGTYLIDNQTNIMPQAKSLEMVIQHRFSNLSDGWSNLFGIYGAANTRLGLNYSITDWAQVSYGITKTYMVSDFGLKLNLLKQSRNNNCPIDVTYYGNWSINGQNEEKFGENYQFNNRFAFFNELLLTRKLCDWATISVGGSFTHFNQADSLWDHDMIALHFLGRFKVTPQSSIIVNCDLPLKVKNIQEWTEIQNPLTYNFGFGYEIATATHVFQIFAGSGQFLVPSYNIMYNDNKFFYSTKDIVIGFNITRQWNF